MNIFAVVPILPTLAPLLLLLPVLILSALAAVASLFRPAMAKAVLRLMWRQKAALLVLIALACAAPPTIRWLAPKSTPPMPFAIPKRTPHTSHLAPASAWPVARGTLARRGWADRQPGPVRGGVRWSAGRPGEAFYGSPAVVAGRVYAVGSHGDSGLIYCWDADTGRRLWSTAPAGYRATFSSPVVSGRYLVCGEGLHRTRRARVVCLDLAEGREGTILWTFATNGHVECTPAIDGEFVYANAGDDGVYCLWLDPEVPDAVRLVWHAPGGRYPDAETSLAVHQGRVYVGLGNGGEAVCVLDAATGRELARVAMPYPVFSPPAISDGKLFVGMGYGDYVHAPERPAGQVCCLDLASLLVEWSFRTDATVIDAVVAVDDQVVFGCADGWLYVLDRRGRLQGRWNSHAPIMSAPAVTDDLIYVVNRAGMLYALDRRWLQTVWELRLGRAGSSFTAPVVASGRLFVGTEDGFRCAGEPAGDSLSAVWPGHLGGPGAAGCVDNSPLPPEVDVQWEVSRLPSQPATFVVTGPLAAPSGSVLVPVQSEVRTGLACFEPAAPGRLRWFHETPHAVGLSPAASGGFALVVDGRPGDAGRHAFCLDLATGRLIWKRPVETAASGVLSVNDDRAFLQDSTDALGCLSLDGGDAQPQWRLPLGPLCQGVDASTAILVAAVASPPSLVAADRDTGTVLWRVPLAAAPTTAPAVCRDRICVATTAAVESRRLIDGRLLWRLDHASTTALYHDPERCAFIDADGDLVVVDADSGRATHSPTDAAPGTVPLVAANGILVPGTGRLWRFALTGEPPDATGLGPADLGRLTWPLVLSDGRLYVGVAGRGVVCLGGEPLP